MSVDMWSLNEAINMANLLDDIGLFKQADLLDQYVKAIKEENIIKQSALWDRFKGWAKTKLFDEYKELVDRAKEVQTALDGHMEEIATNHKSISKDLKNYQLNDWRLRLYDINQKAKDINNLTKNFDKTYGRFLQVITNVQKLDPTKTQSGTLSPSEKIERIFQQSANKPPSRIMEDVKDLIDTSDLTGDTATELPDESPTATPSQKPAVRPLKVDADWSLIDTRLPFAQINVDSGDVRFSADKQTQFETHTTKIKGDGGILHGVNTTAGGKRPDWLVKLLGDKYWKLIRTDKEWWYLTPAPEAEQPQLLTQKKSPAGSPPPLPADVRREIAPSGFDTTIRAPEPISTQTVQQEEVQQLQPEDIQEIQPEEVKIPLSTAPEEAVIPTAEPSIPTTTTTTTLEELQQKINRRRMARCERGEIPVKEKKSGRIVWTYPKNITEAKHERLAPADEARIISECLEQARKKKERTASLFDILEKTAQEEKEYRKEVIASIILKSQE